MVHDTLIRLDHSTIMKGLSLTIVILVISIFYLDAFLPSSRRFNSQRSFGADESSSVRLLETKFLEKPASRLTHRDILWKVRPPPETSVVKRLWLRFAANMIRLDCLIKGQEPPLCLCPKGGMAVLEAHFRPSDSYKYEKIGRFGFSTERGAPSPEIQESVSDLYGIEPSVGVGVAAIIYMFVEPQHRRKELGSLALQVISLIHAIQGCDFTVLVADDNGSGKLIDWYQRHGFAKAPKLQNLMGSPNAVHGITMISPTQRTLPYDCHIQWW